MIGDGSFQLWPVMVLYSSAYLAPQPRFCSFRRSGNVSRCEVNVEKPLWPCSSARNRMTPFTGVNVKNSRTDRRTTVTYIHVSETTYTGQSYFHRYMYYSNISFIHFVTSGPPHLPRTRRSPPIIKRTFRILKFIIRVRTSLSRAASNQRHRILRENSDPA